jgi:hypothetical protein
VADDEDGAVVVPASLDRRPCHLRYLPRMESGPASLAMNIGPTEALLIALVALPVLVLPLLVVFWAFRLGKRQGAAEARERMSQESPPNG